MYYENIMPPIKTSVRKLLTHPNRSNFSLFEIVRFLSYIFTDFLLGTLRAPILFFPPAESPFGICRTGKLGLDSPITLY